MIVCSVHMCYDLMLTNCHSEGSEARMVQRQMVGQLKQLRAEKKPLVQECRMQRAQLQEQAKDIVVSYESVEFYKCHC